MSDTVQFYGPDGTAREALVLSTSSTTRFFRGTVPAGTVDVEVALGELPYSTDPALVELSGTLFTVPNPAAYPDGLPLVAGDNRIAARAVLLGGGRTPPAEVVVTLVAQPAYDAYGPPTPVTVEQRESSVVVTVEVNSAAAGLVGYHYYAAREPGGGATGYVRLTPSPVAQYTTRPRTTPLFTLTAQSLLTGEEPRYLRATLTQEDAEGAVRATDVHDRVELPTGSDRLETTVSIARYETVLYSSYEHRRNGTPQSDPPTVFVGQFASLDYAEPLYYVVTAVYWAAALNTEFESVYSAEVRARPIPVRGVVVGLPAVSRSQILENAIATLHRADPNIAVQPGAVVRDVVLDPFATEAERLRFLLDFFYRATSFDLLLAIDDPEGTGESVEPASSAYKTALASAFFLANVADVQAVIDGAFEKLASNLGVPRRAGRRARTEVRFYTAVTPLRTLPVPLGTGCVGGGVQFRTVRTAELPVDQLASYYDPTQRTYSITVPVEAVNVGSEGNVGARQINSASVYGFSVVNDSAAYGGMDRESNARLAARAREGLSAVDTGTQRGLARVASEVAGVVAAEVVRAGSPLMLRDYDPLRGSHVGGKVDVWARGRRGATVRDTFHFSYQRRYGIQFELVGDPSLYTFRALDPALSPEQPLAAMLDYEERNLGLRNLSSGAYFNLTGITYVNYNTIRLSSAPGVTQPAVTLAHVVTGDYRYRQGQQYVLARQPVAAVYGVVGERSGALDPQTYTLVHPHPALGWGRSSRAGDYVSIIQSTDPSVVAPTGVDLTVTGELHVLAGFYSEAVARLGADPLTVIVQSEDELTTYRAPDHPSGSPDYTVTEGTATTPLTLQRTRTSTIPDGGSVRVSYRHAENFTVTYQVNLVTSALQEALQEAQHAGADVIAKETLEVPVDLTLTVLLERGAQRAQVDRSIRARLTHLLSTLRTGQPLRRSDVIATVDRTPGVSYVLVPLTRMARARGSLVAYDPLSITSPRDAHRVAAWSTPTVSTWLLAPSLMAPTLNGGGAERAPGQYRGVFQDSVPLSLQITDPAALGGAPGRAFIVGADGLLVPEYSSLPVAHRVLVSLPVGQVPVGRRYWATYVVGVSEGEYDITLSSVEYLVLGALTVTYGEDPSS